MTAELRRLSGTRMPLTVLIPPPRGAGRIAVFADGTRLYFGGGSGGGLERLGRDGARRPLWLAEVQPCFGRRRFWLGFAPDARARPLEVLVSVAPVPPGAGRLSY